MTTPSSLDYESHSFVINGSSLTWSQLKLPFIVSSHPSPYSVEIIDTLASYQAILDGANFIIADRNIIDLYGSFASITADTFIVDPTEDNKNLDTVSSIINKMIDAGISKGSKVLAIGGGIIQDISACACALFRRGQPFTYLPTTTLGQLDSCVGAKCALNTQKAKNILGLFSAPAHVKIPIFMILSMPLTEHRAGLSEMLRLCLTASDASVKKYHELLPNISDPTVINLSAYSEAISLSLSIKKSVVEFDEYEKDVRRSMNYGHTFGHAVEKLSGFQLPHGLGVLLGMHIANQYATSIGIMPSSCLSKLTPVFKQTIAGVNLSLPSFSNLDPEEIISQFRYDKKGDGSSVPLILIERPGSMVFYRYTFSQPHDILVKAIKSGLEDFLTWINLG